MGTLSNSPGLVPTRLSFTSKEWRLIRRLSTPRSVQNYLHSLPYNHEKSGETLRSFRRSLALGTVHCMEAALMAATILEQHGYPPLLLSFESVDLLDHVIFIFRQRGRWGSVARSRDAGLHGRRPIFRTLRDLAWSYFDPYVDLSGRLKGYAPVSLYELGNYDWRFSKRNLWKLERFLVDYPHRPMVSSDARYRRLFRRYRAYRRDHPTGPVVYYSNRHWWM